MISRLEHDPGFELKRVIGRQQSRAPLAGGRGAAARFVERAQLREQVVGHFVGTQVLLAVCRAVVDIPPGLDVAGSLVVFQLVGGEDDVFVEQFDIPSRKPERAGAALIVGADFDRCADGGRS